MSSVLLSPTRQNQLQLTNFAYSEDLTTSDLPPKNKALIKFSTSETNLKTYSNVDNESSLEDQEEEDEPKIKCGNIELSEYTSPE